MAEGNVLLTPTPVFVSSDVLIEEIAPAALAAPEVTKTMHCLSFTLDLAQVLNRLQSNLL